jgi:hypothetical protein
MYKCNAKQHGYQKAWGDWDEFFSRGHRAQRWGKTEWTPSIAQLRRGDMILAYQTNRNELVGTARVKQSCDRDGWLYLERLDRIGVKVRPLKKSDPEIAAISALRPGPIMTVYPVSRDEAARLLIAAGAPFPVFHDDSRRLPDAPQPEAEVDLLDFIDAQRLAAQGFMTNPSMRKAVERYAVDQARHHYEKRGFEVREHGKPFDLKCQKGRTSLFVEVKGTQTSGAEVIVTPNEVEFAQKNKMELFLLHSVEVTLRRTRYLVSGGIERVVRRWRPRLTELRPLAYSCSIR